MTKNNTKIKTSTFMAMVLTMMPCHGFVHPFGMSHDGKSMVERSLEHNKRRSKCTTITNRNKRPASQIGRIIVGVVTAAATTDNFEYAGSVRPGLVSPQKRVADDNLRRIPEYATNGTPGPRPFWIDVKTTNEIESMKESGKLARSILDTAGRAVQVGVSTDEIDALVHDEIVKAGGYPSPLNYYNFPKSCCTSVNEVVCHGIPDNRKLQNGDIINIDITVYLNGFHGDCSEMFVVGDALEDDDDDTKRLLQTTYDSWILACQYVQPGHVYRNIGGIIEDYVTARGFTTVMDFCGHGIGRSFQTKPDILHFHNNVSMGKMKAGHTFTIEPMICEGTNQVLMWQDGWTATTMDGKRSAQFEHTLLVTEDGVEALTGKTEDSMMQFWEKESAIHQGIWLGTSQAAKERAEQINKMHDE